MEEENGVVEEGTEPTGADAPEPTGEEGAEPSEQEAPPADPAVEPEPKRNKVQERIDEITRARRQAEQEAASLRYELQVARGEIQPPQPQMDPPVPGLPPKPQLDQFDDYDDYVEALGAWGAEKTILAREHKAAQAKVKEAQQAVHDSHAARVEASKAKYTDWDDVAAIAPPMQFSDDAFNAIMESDQSADIAYHLFKTPGEIERLNGLSRVQQIKEVTRLEDRFKATPQPVKRVSQAPAPINTLGGAGADVLAAKEPDAATDPDGWLKWEKARVNKLGRRY